MFLLVIFAYAFIGLYEVIPLVKAKEFGKVVVFVIFLLVAFVPSLLLSLGVKISSPEFFIENVVNAITGQK